MESSRSRPRRCRSAAAGARSAPAGGPRRARRGTRQAVSATLVQITSQVVQAISAELQRNEFGVVLKLPLPFQKLIITTTRPVRIIAADARPRLVNRATAGLDVEEHADAAVDLILLMPEDGAVLGRLREAFGRRFGINLEVLGKTVDVAFRNADVFVTAAVRRTLAAIVKGSHHGIVTVPVSSLHG